MPKAQTKRYFLIDCGQDEDERRMILDLEVALCHAAGFSLQTMGVILMGYKLLALEQMFMEVWWFLDKMGFP